MKWIDDMNAGTRDSTRQGICSSAMENICSLDVADSLHTRCINAVPIRKPNVHMFNAASQTVNLNSSFVEMITYTFKKSIRVWLNSEKTVLIVNFLTHVREINELP